MASSSGFVRAVFDTRKAAKEPVFVGFAMEGFPSRDETPPILLALEAGGADIIELAVPHSDPVADGPTLQKVAQHALAGGASAATALASLRLARAAGLRAPVVMFGYYNTFLAYGLERFCSDAHAAGADAILCVDLPPELLQQSPTGPLALVPLVTPTTSDARIASIAAMPDVAFLYCVALLGVTGARAAVSQELPEYMARVRRLVPTGPPLVVGFGISSHASFQEVAAHADGVVAASAMLDAVQARPEGQSAAAVVEAFAKQLTGRKGSLGFPARPQAHSQAVAKPVATERSGPGWFGNYGGAFVSETLRFAVDELAAAFETARHDDSFWREVRSYDSYVGRPTPLHECGGLSARGGARVWLKREDLAHTGAHKINNALGQALLARRIGKKKVIAETGAGQHGVAVATVCAKLGLECIVFMGAVDCERQKLNVFRMKLMGATVVSVESGGRTLKVGSLLFLCA
jgi:tryptophan synthase